MRPTNPPLATDGRKIIIYLTFTDRSMELGTVIAMKYCVRILR